MQRGSEPVPQVDPDAPRDSVLVTDADSPTGDAVVLQLILAGCDTAGSWCSRCWVCCGGFAQHGRPGLHIRSVLVHTQYCCRAKIRVLVRNAQQAVTGYGSYVTPITGDAGNQVSRKGDGDATCTFPAC